MIEAHIEHRNFLQHPDLRGQTAREVIIHQNNLITASSPSSRCSPGYNRRGRCSRKTSTETGEFPRFFGIPNRNRLSFRNRASSGLSKSSEGTEPSKSVESQIQKFQRREGDHDGGELPDEPIVADVELVEELELAERFGDDAAEPIGVDVEEGQICEEAELGGEVPGDVGVVEVDAGDDAELGVGQRRGAEDAGVGADGGAGPVGGEVERVGVDGLLP
ncbi:unnamed protein product [Linum tenue]|uniref:Uncharacterized protein n=1 Tax=Linum tenue TaxID=586396 RepID=A0AAV0RB04_9ROSI|nr:unnamed protein product [Linum tenue]